MLDKLKDFVKNTLDKLNFLDSEERLSLTNITVALFVGIAAFRMLLGGSVLNIHGFNWNIQTIDVSDTLPVMFSLLNYGHKRSLINTARKDDKNNLTSTDEKEK